MLEQECKSKSARALPQLFIWPPFYKNDAALLPMIDFIHTVSGGGEKENGEALSPSRLRIACKRSVSVSFGIGKQGTPAPPGRRKATFAAFSALQTCLCGRRIGPLAFWGNAGAFGKADDDAFPAGRRGGSRRRRPRHRPQNRCCPCSPMLPCLDTTDIAPYERRAVLDGG